jgi:hypothetical protein
MKEDKLRVLLPELGKEMVKDFEEFSDRFLGTHAAILSRLVQCIRFGAWEEKLAAEAIERFLATRRGAEGIGAEGKAEVGEVVLKEEWQLREESADELAMRLGDIVEAAEKRREGGSIYRKTLLLQLIEHLTRGVQRLSDSDPSLGKLLFIYGKVLSDIGWAIAWGSIELKEKVIEIVDDTLRMQEEGKLKCKLEEWLRWKIGEVVAPAMKEMEGQMERKIEETETPYQENKDKERPF